MKSMYIKWLGIRLESIKSYRTLGFAGRVGYNIGWAIINVLTFVPEFLLACRYPEECVGFAALAGTELMENMLAKMPTD